MIRNIILVQGRKRWTEALISIYGFPIIIIQAVCPASTMMSNFRGFFFFV